MMIACASSGVVLELAYPKGRRDYLYSSRGINLLKDSEWAIIDREPCRAIDFTGFAYMNNGKLENASIWAPLGVVTFECKKLPGEVRGYITHKIDFANLWKVFKERGVKEDEEVIIIWTKTHYKIKLMGLFSSSLPKLIVYVSHKHAYEILTDPDNMGLRGEAWGKAISPIVELKPEIMD